jgi:hypothetical protein
VSDDGRTIAVFQQPTTANVSSCRFLQSQSGRTHDGSTEDGRLLNLEQLGAGRLRVDIGLSGCSANISMLSRVARTL